MHARSEGGLFYWEREVRKLHIPLDMVVTILVAVFSSGGLWAFVQHQIDKKDKKKSAMENGMLSLLHDRIYSIAQDAIEKGYMTFEDFENLGCMYKPYHNLGGNGTGKDLYERARDLPRKKG